MAESKPTERVELTQSVLVVGCKHYTWDQDAFDLDEDLTHNIRFVADPNNPHQPDGKAVKVNYRGKQCGNVAAVDLDDMEWFMRATRIVQPFVKDFDARVETSRVTCDSEGFKTFMLELKVCAWVPVEVCKELDALA